jgi:hypothetical protein
MSGCVEEPHPNAARAVAQGTGIKIECATWRQNIELRDVAKNNPEPRVKVRPGKDTPENQARLREFLEYWMHLAEQREIKSEKDENENDVTNIPRA